jgi:ABC-type branched-subunit amino acid transport system ATPase component
VIRVGLNVELTGTIPVVGESSKNAAELAVKEVNNAGGITILLVEQNARQALKLAHRGYVLQTGRLTVAGSADELMDAPSVKAAYLGG